jgi:hypothetical protein
MIKFKTPANLNGLELVDELKKAKVKIDDFPTLDGNGELWLPIAEADEAKAQAVVEAHNGSTEAKPLSVEQKLASVGLSIDDLKAALSS